MVWPNSIGKFSLNLPVQVRQNLVKNVWLNLLAVLCIVFALISAVEKFSIEELNPDHSKNELKEDVDDEDVEDIF